jgi:hypothetical protein
LRDAAVSPPELFYLSKERSTGKGVDRYKEGLKQEHTCIKGIIALSNTSARTLPGKGKGRVHGLESDT